jgi:hypothetical protein
MFTKMLVTLSSETRSKTLCYRIRSHHSAQIWANCVNQANLKSQLRENDRFYNFPKNPRSSLENVLTMLTETIETLRVFHPEIKIPSINRADIQASVNQLHFEFAHGHHVTKIIDDKNAKAWSDFNIFLHNIESLLKSDYIKKTTGLFPARIVFTWEVDQRVSIPESCYKDFSLRQEFGMVYANYSQVGRQFAEMCFAGDDILADEHIQPSRYISADTMLWFGATAGHNWEITSFRKIEKWFAERSQRFNNLGFFWPDPKLSLGHIPVARLENELHSISEISEFIEDLEGLNTVSAVQIK